MICAQNARVANNVVTRYGNRVLIYADYLGKFTNFHVAMVTYLYSSGLGGVHTSSRFWSENIDLCSFC